MVFDWKGFYPEDSMVNHVLHSHYNTVFWYPINATSLIDPGKFHIIYETNRAFESFEHQQLSYLSNIHLILLGDDFDYIRYPVYKLSAWL